MSSYLRTTGIALCTGALLVGGGGAATAAPNNANQTGLVNLAIQDVTVQVPVALAANICGVPITILSAGLAAGPVDCDAQGEATATREPGGGGGNNANQTGLVNIAVQDADIQVPLAVAANVCGVPVSVLSGFVVTEEVTCQALADAAANA